MKIGRNSSMKKRTIKIKTQYFIRIGKIINGVIGEKGTLSIYLIIEGILCLSNKVD